jgi:hypothetical protein
MTVTGIATVRRGQRVSLTSFVARGGREKAHFEGSRDTTTWRFQVLNLRRTQS